MNADAVLFLLGITRKAGKLISGQESVEKATNAKKVFLILVSKDASENTKERMRYISINANVPIFYFYQSDEISKAIGKGKIKVIGITDKGLAEEIQRRIKLLTGVGDIDEITSI